MSIFSSCSTIAQAAARFANFFEVSEFNHDFQNVNTGHKIRTTGASFHLQLNNSTSHFEKITKLIVVKRWSFINFSKSYCTPRDVQHCLSSDEACQSAINFQKRFLSKPCDCRNSCNRETGLSPILSSSETYEDFGILKRFSYSFPPTDVTLQLLVDTNPSTSPQEENPTDFPQQFFRFHQSQHVFSSYMLCIGFLLIQPFFRLTPQFQIRYQTHLVIELLRSLSDFNPEVFYG